MNSASPNLNRGEKAMRSQRSILGLVCLVLLAFHAHAWASCGCESAPILSPTHARMREASWTLRPEDGLELQGTSGFSRVRHDDSMEHCERVVLNRLLISVGGSRADVVPNQHRL